MSIWTRISEALALVGDSIGSFLIKLAKSRVSAPEKSLGFTIGMIALGAKMAKADGIVTGEEVKAFKQVFHVPQSELAAVARVFNLAKQDVAGYDTYARQIARLFHAKASTLENVMDGLFHIAKADGTLHPAELIYLENVAQLFGFGAHDFARIKARHASAGVDDPYLILGVERAAGLAAIKVRYRKLVRDNHPDKQIAAGVPEEMVVLATDRLARINAAYEQILKEHQL
ncbi:MAG TPA: DnaJ family molecular chaperone [Aestuariivirga sp.]|nr:DnaJ family molecular chaperone [Aestuariivirga sp.]